KDRNVIAVAMFITIIVSTGIFGSVRLVRIAAERSPKSSVVATNARAENNRESDEGDPGCHRPLHLGLDTDREEHHDQRGTRSQPAGPRFGVPTLAHRLGLAPAEHRQSAAIVATAAPVISTSCWKVSRITVLGVPAAAQITS